MQAGGAPAAGDAPAVAAPAPAPLAVPAPTTAPATGDAQPQFVFIKRAGGTAADGEVYAKLAILPGDDVADLAARACAEFGWGSPSQARLYLVVRSEVGGEAPSADDEKKALAGDALFPAASLQRAGVRVGALLLARVSQPAVAAASFEDLLVASGMREEDVRGEVVRRAFTRYGGVVAGALAGAGRPEAAADVYALAASLPSLTTGADFRLAGVHVNGLLFDGGALVRCFRELDEFVLKPLDARENARALALHEALAARAPIPGLSTFELHPRGAKLFMLMPRYGASLEHLPALSGESARVLWQSISGALRGLHALGFAHMDVKPANICVSSAQSFALVDLGSVARFGEATATTPPYVAADFPGAMRRSSARADWWQFAMTLAEKACGGHCLDVGARAPPAMAALVARLREHLPAALWRELEPLLEVAV
jgi:hypothetical protein